MSWGKLKCPRCNHKTEIVSEYYDFKLDCLIRDSYCGNCKSVTVFKYYSDSSYSSEWIDLNVRD